MMSNLFNDLDLETVLQCPVCLEIPPNLIYLCKVGHHMCDKCKVRLTLCPTCQSPMTKSRNFLAEALISKLEVLRTTADTLQENIKPTATTERVLPKFPQLPDNNNRLKPLPLPPGNFNCLLESCRQKKIATHGGIYEHVLLKHSHIYDKNDESANFLHNFENFCLVKNRRKFHQCFHVSNMGLFFLSIQILNDFYMNCWLSMPVPISTANNFYYQLQFTKENNNTKFSLVNKVASNLQLEEWLMERGRVFVISPFEHQLKYNDFFSLSIKIVYRPPGFKKDFSME